VQVAAFESASVLVTVHGTQTEFQKTKVGPHDAATIVLAPENVQVKIPVVEAPHEVQVVPLRLYPGWQAVAVTVVPLIVHAPIPLVVVVLQGEQIVPFIALPGEQAVQVVGFVHAAQPGGQAMHPVAGIMKNPMGVH